MRRTFSAKCTFRSSYSRYVRPRLEALEDRCLPSGSPLGLAATETITSLNFNPQQVLVLPDGKILLGKTINAFSYQLLPMVDSGQNNVAPTFDNPTVRAIELVRLNADGSLDSSFGSGGIDVVRPDLSDSFDNFAVQPDGQIIVADNEISSGAGYVVTASPNWKPGDPFTGWPGDFVWQDSGVRILRLNADGSVDPTFQSGNIASYRVEFTSSYGSYSAVTVQPDGKILFAGEGTFGTGVILARYNPDGSFDTGFGPGGQQPGVVTNSLPNDPLLSFIKISTLQVEGDGKILVGANEAPEGVLLLRYNADGSADAGFGSDGVVHYAAASNAITYLGGLVVQPDGTILATGSYQLLEQGFFGGMFLLRLNADGSLDGPFGQQGVVQFATNSDPLGPYPVTLPDGGATIEADLVGAGGEIFRLGGADGVVVAPDGTIDVVAVAAVCSAQADVSAGAGWTGASQWLVASFNPDGSLAGVQLTTFGVPNAGVDQLGMGTAPDGSIVVVGYLLGANGANWLNKDVLVDYQFGAGSGPVSAAMPPSQTSTALSEATFEALALSSTGRGTSTAPDRTVADPLAVQIPSPLITAPLPVFTESQSAAVARLSGGGGGFPTTDDPFGLTGEPDGTWNLALAGGADAAG